jgi:Family of unknown function (DUF6491)
MKRTAMMLATVLVAACATSQPELDKEAVDDFVAVRKLEPVDAIRTDSGDGWTELNNDYLLYRTRRGDYLVKFARRCYKLDDRYITPDKRWDGTRIEARYDTIRGCRIGNIYALSEADVAELQHLGEAPGNRNE